MPELSSPYFCFDRQQWSAYARDTPLYLSEEETESLAGLNEPITLDEVREIYLPLTRLLRIYAESTKTLHQASVRFLGAQIPKVPYIIGVVGSVAVGKSTLSRVLRALLARSQGTSKVELITTDGFLYPSRTLEELGLMERKGFPESYDQRALIQLLQGLKSGLGSLKVPLYSHEKYDIIPGAFHTLDHPDIVIVEGLNLLQTNYGSVAGVPRHFVSDFLDFSIYVDASIEYLRQWYLERFLMLRDKAREHPATYFYKFAQMSTPEALKTAHAVWEQINERNLIQNIEPYKYRAHLILEKDRSHSVTHAHLRKL